METKDNESTGSVHKISICNYKAVNTLTWVTVHTDPLGSQDFKSPLLSLSQVKYSSAKPGDLCQFVFPTTKYWILLLGVIQNLRLHNYLHTQPLYFSLQYKKPLTTGQILLSFFPVKTTSFSLISVEPEFHTIQGEQLTSPVSGVPVVQVTWRFLFHGISYQFCSLSF